MSRPPPPVAFVAKVHGVVGLIILASVALLHAITSGLPVIEFRPRTYALAFGLGALYLATATLVWFGATPGHIVSRVCSLLYLARPGFGLTVWEAMRHPDFTAHFNRK